MRTSAKAFAVAAAAVLALPAAAVAQPQTQSGTLRVPTIEWQTCPDDAFLQCAGVEVPLDYDKPRGEKITLRVVKRPADQPSAKIGTLFVNPGGPGGSSADWVPSAAEHLGQRTRDAFDVVGIDPRGVAGSRNCVTDGCGSAPLFCTVPQGEVPPAVPQFAFPYSDAEVRQHLAFDDYVRGLCDRTGGKIIDHMSTADVVRDMELMRRAVGDPKLTYYGISYGSMVGSTYAAMYPNTIRALIVDGVLDPVQWSTGRGSDRNVNLTSRVGSAEGAHEALVTGLAECDRVGPEFCAAAGDALGKWNAVMAYLKQQPLQTPEGEVTYSLLTGQVLSAMYRQEGFPLLTDFLQAAYAQITAAPTARTAGGDAGASWKTLSEAAPQGAPRFAPPGVTSAAADEPVSFYGAFLGVACSDSANPSDRNAPFRSLERAVRHSPDLGRAWSWSGTTCSRWPGSSADAYRGPWNKRTSAPILVSSTTQDPATPISGARAVEKLFPNSRLLVTDAWAHGAIGYSCASAAFQDYLVDGKLPAKGASCTADGPLYPARG